MEYIEKRYQLEQEEGTIVGDDNLKVYITEYYKKIFGPPEDNSFEMIENRIDDIPQLSEEENVLLTANFTEEEVFQVITQMEHNKSLGPDGFPAEFYQKNWDVIKEDPMAMFGHFQAGFFSFVQIKLRDYNSATKKR
jgi:hypothetical protein